MDTIRNILLGDMTQIAGNFLWLLLLLTVWSICWKGVALWKAGRAGSKWWFVILLIVNTVGILEILYIFIFSKMGKSGQTSRAVNQI